MKHATGRELYLETRAGFVRAGTSLGVWCRENGVRPQNARQALMGAWAGPKATGLVARMVAASKVPRQKVAA